jgi:hypothetical protein
MESKTQIAASHTPGHINCPACMAAADAPSNRMSSLSIETPIKSEGNWQVDSTGLEAPKPGAFRRAINFLGSEPHRPPAAVESKAKPARRVTLGTIILGVFVGNLLTAIVAGIIYAMLTVK